MKRASSRWSDLGARPIHPGGQGPQLPGAVRALPCHCGDALAVDALIHVLVPVHASGGYKQVPATHSQHDSRATLLITAGFAVYWAAALGADSLGGGLAVQALVSLMTWLVLGTALWRAPGAQRVLVLAVIVVATGFECVGSLVWGAYRYRYGNLPLYVPPGHGLFYLMAARLSALPFVQRHGPATVAAVALRAG